MYLIDGKHYYRFLVDSHWIADPANPVKEKDGDGNLNSVLNLGQTVNFKLNGYPNAKKVILSGNFNNWKTDELSMKKVNGSWILPLTLTAGNYDYKFIVDGQWITDPLNPYYAVEQGQTNSYISVRPNHTFKLKGYANKKRVTLNGTFDSWNTGGYSLARHGDEWIIDFYLKPGKYLYKFEVDGRWILDPDNKLWEPGENDTDNSVLWME